MKINVNHPSFISFLENITTEVLNNVTTANYFKLTHDKKMGVLYMVYKLLKKSMTLRTTLSDNEMKAFLVVLWKKNEENENYEFAAILNDIINNYEAVNNFIKPIKKPRKAKIDNSTNA